jgi:hypothetical protein
MIINFGCNGIYRLVLLWLVSLPAWQVLGRISIRRDFNFAHHDRITLKVKTSFGKDEFRFHGL